MQNLTAQQRQPKTLKKLDDGFQIVWKDGLESFYLYGDLRQLCPCAECSIIRNDGADVHSLFSKIGIGDQNKIELSSDLRAISVDLVGRYAIRFVWNDGHNSGIYTFEHLRRINSNLEKK